MLQDFPVLMGLRIDGASITGHIEGAWTLLVEELLGVRPEPTYTPDGKIQKTLERCSLRSTWLRSMFNGDRPLPEDASEEIMMQYAQAYILVLMGSILFVEKMEIQCSWCICHF